jgi:hypothetical protein
MSSTRKPTPETIAILGAVRDHVAEQNAALEKKLTATLSDITRATDAALATVRGVATESAATMHVMVDAKAARVSHLSATFAKERDNVLAWLKRITLPPPDIASPRPAAPSLPAHNASE